MADSGVVPQVVIGAAAAAAAADDGDGDGDGDVSVVTHAGASFPALPSSYETIIRNIVMTMMQMEAWILEREHVV